MKAQNKDKVKVLLGRLNSLENSSFPDIKSLSDEIISKEYSTVTDQVKNSSTVKMLDALDAKLNQFKKDFDLKPISEAIQEFKNNIGQISKDTQDQFTASSVESESKVAQLRQELADAQSQATDSSSKSNQALLNHITELKGKIQMLSDRKIDMPDFGPQIGEVEVRMKKLINSLKIEVQGSDKSTGLQTQITDMQEGIQKLRKEFIQRIGNLGGGAMNRQMFIGGVDPLTRYTDMNLKAGAGMTITYVNNDTTKKVDVTFTSSGGGGGTVRSINSVSTNTVAGSTSGTDYVYLCSGTMTITLPDATTNTNLYTIKNVGTGTITINTTSSQTIDASLTAVLSVRYTAIDVVSDTANWNVT